MMCFLCSFTTARVCYCAERLLVLASNPDLSSHHSLAESVSIGRRRGGRGGGGGGETLVQILTRAPHPPRRSVSCPPALPPRPERRDVRFSSLRYTRQSIPPRVDVASIGSSGDEVDQAISRMERKRQLRRRVEQKRNTEMASSSDSDSLRNERVRTEERAQGEEGAEQPGTSAPPLSVSVDEEMLSLQSTQSSLPHPAVSPSRFAELVSRRSLRRRNAERGGRREEERPDTDDMAVASIDIGEESLTGEELADLDDEEDNAVVPTRLINRSLVNLQHVAWDSSPAHSGSASSVPAPSVPVPPQFAPVSYVADMEAFVAALNAEPDRLSEDRRSRVEEWVEQSGQWSGSDKESSPQSEEGEHSFNRDYRRRSTLVSDQPMEQYNFWHQVAGGSFPSNAVGEAAIESILEDPLSRQRDDAFRCPFSSTTEEASPERDREVDTITAVVVEQAAPPAPPAPAPPPTPPAPSAPDIDRLALQTDVIPVQPKSSPSASDSSPKSVNTNTSSIGQTDEPKVMQVPLTAISSATSTSSQEEGRGREGRGVEPASALQKKRLGQDMRGLSENSEAPSMVSSTLDKSSLCRARFTSNLHKATDCGDERAEDKFWLHCYSRSPAHPSSDQQAACSSMRLPSPPGSARSAIYPPLDMDSSSSEEHVDPRFVAIAQHRSQAEGAAPQGAGHVPPPAEPDEPDRVAVTYESSLRSKGDEEYIGEKLRCPDRSDTESSRSIVLGKYTSSLSVSSTDLVDVEQENSKADDDPRHFFTTREAGRGREEQLEQWEKELREEEDIGGVEEEKEQKQKEITAPINVSSGRGLPSPIIRRDVASQTAERQEDMSLATRTTLNAQLPMPGRLSIGSCSQSMDDLDRPHSSGRKSVTFSDHDEMLDSPRKMRKEKRGKLETKLRQAAKSILKKDDGQRDSIRQILDLAAEKMYNELRMLVEERDRVIRSLELTPPDTSTLSIDTAVQQMKYRDVLVKNHATLDIRINETWTALKDMYLDPIKAAWVFSVQDARHLTLERPKSRGLVLPRRHTTYFKIEKPLSDIELASRYAAKLASLRAELVGGKTGDGEEEEEEEVQGNDFDMGALLDRVTRACQRHV